MDKLSLEFQKKFIGNLIYKDVTLNDIDQSVRLHGETKNNPLSSSAACLNVFGSLSKKPDQLKYYLNSFGLNISEIINFPSGADVGGLKYNDKGNVIFEWIGPKKSPINEIKGGRGYLRTSIDAFIIAKIKEKMTQILIEWKFTEGKSRPLALQRFAGGKGLERLRRYSSVLVQWKNKDKFPFVFDEENGLGLYDFSPDHLYQLMRITLLAKATTPIKIGKLNIQDYRILHLSHSSNDMINIMLDKYLTHSPGLNKYSGKKLSKVWNSVLANKDKNKFISGYWNNSIKDIKDIELRNYLLARY